MIPAKNPPRPGPHRLAWGKKRWYNVHKDGRRSREQYKTRAEALAAYRHSSSVAYTASCPKCHRTLKLAMSPKVSAVRLMHVFTIAHRLARPKCQSGLLLLPMLAKLKRSVQ